MKKSIRDDKICMVFENIEEAKDALVALTLVKLFFTEHHGRIFEIKDIQEANITVMLKARINELTAQNDGDRIKV